jgi:LAS superfamily LD-carboxypeptidase LdcB
VTGAFLTGRDAGSLVELAGGQRLLPEAAAAFAALAADARAAGFDLQIASAYRSFDRQLAIFNAKALGERAVLDDDDHPIDLRELDVDARIDAILRFSALPGASRHHWGTDLDVFDAAALPPGERVALSVAEVAPGAIFDPLHCWLDARIASGDSHGFYRPYDLDRGGVAPERWHLSYAPLATAFEEAFSAELLRECWCAPCASSLCWRPELEARLQELTDRYVLNVSPAPA